jgi:hypothetical protein
MTQTFFPLPDPRASARVVDNKRCGNQVREGARAVRALDNPNSRRHAVVDMWRGYRAALVEYGLAFYAEWKRRFDNKERGGKRDHASGEWLLTQRSGEPVVWPPWVGTWAVHSRYRALLLSKCPGYYQQFGWGESPNPERYYPI